MARALLLVRWMAGSSYTLLALSAGGGCVIPPPGDFAEGDAGPSAPPVIVSAAPAEFAFPGPMTLDHGDQRRLAVTLRDVDVEDTLYLQLYVDYNLPSQINYSGRCVAVPSGEQLRVADCSTASLCNGIDDSDIHLLDGMVADRDFLDDSDPLAAGQPAFRALPPTAASSIRSWLMECNP